MSLLQYTVLIIQGIRNISAVSLLLKENSTHMVLRTNVTYVLTIQGLTYTVSLLFKD